MTISAVTKSRALVRQAALLNLQAAARDGFAAGLDYTALDAVVWDEWLRFCEDLRIVPTEDVLSSDSL